ncbi:MAG: chaperone modulator CbpM [Coxiellaceae bacterium]|nr:chaperone modulator CbpM [Coxiellaceae bacterium]
MTDIINDTHNEITLEELSQALCASPDFVIALVEYEVIQPHGDHQDSWRFNAVCIHRARIAASFQRDLHVNLSGINLALDLLEQIDELKAELARSCPYDNEK